MRCKAKYEKTMTHADRDRLHETTKYHLSRTVWLDVYVYRRPCKQCQQFRCFSSKNHGNLLEFYVDFLFGSSLEKQNPI